jgi:PAS domain S-box-containing protein
MVELSGYSTKLKKSKPNSKKAKEKVSKKLSKTPRTCDQHTLSRDMLEAILENIPSAVIIVEKPEGEIVFANNRTVELHGINPWGISFQQLAEKLKILALNPDVYPNQQLYTYRSLFLGETMRNLPIVIERVSDKKPLIINVSTKPLTDKEGNINAAIAIFDDVTERVQTQNELKESEKRLNWSQQIAHLGNWEYRIKEDKAIWSEELFRIFGLEPKPFGPNATEYISKIHPEDQAEIDKKSKDLASGNLNSKASFDYRIIRQDGEIRTIHSERRVREVGPDNKPTRIDGVEQDITERRLDEQKLADYAKN